jgi:hypothetical protein
METVTSILGRELRRFCSVTCAAFSTVELPKEAKVRGRKQSRRQAGAGVQEAPPPPTSPLATVLKKTKKKKRLNLSTYKVHALGDYPRTIRMFGATDSYSTQTVNTILIGYLAL